MPAHQRSPPQIATTTETPAEASRLASQVLYMAESGSENYGACRRLSF